jgi:hypothetical protein
MRYNVGGGKPLKAIRFTTVVGPDGIIRPPAGITSPEGEIDVPVRSSEVQRPNSTSPDLTYGWLVELAAEAEREATQLPADLAENHDHYAHGKPKS